MDRRVKLYSAHINHQWRSWDWPFGSSPTHQCLRPTKLLSWWRQVSTPGAFLPRQVWLNNCRNFKEGNFQKQKKPLDCYSIFLSSFLNPVCASVLNEIPGTLVWKGKSCVENGSLTRKPIEEKMSKHESTKKLCQTLLLCHVQGKADFPICL